MANIKLHNPELAENSMFTNLIVEQRAANPVGLTTTSQGRIWFDTVGKKLKGAFLDEAGTGIDIKPLVDEDDVNIINNSIEALSNTLTDETANREAADGDLTSLTTDVKTDLVSAINSEVDARTLADEGLQNAITVLEGQVDGNIGSLDDIDASLDNTTLVAAINSELARAELAEEGLTNDLTDEIANRIAADGNLTTLTTSVKTDLVSAINSEVARAELAEEALSNDLVAETERAILADEALANDISDNYLNKTTVDPQTVEAITTFKDTLSVDGATTLGDALTAQDTIVHGDLYIEKVEGSNGGLVVRGDLTVEGTTTTVNTETLDVADSNITLNSNVSGTDDVTGLPDAGLSVNRGTEGTQIILNWNETSDQMEVTEGNNTDGYTLKKIATETDIQTEVDARTLADEGLSNAISELQSAVGGDTGDLATLKTTSKSTLVGAINEVHDDVLTEQARAELAEDGLTNSISDEAATRLANDNTLQSNITTEETARILGDDTLTNALSDETARAELAEETNANAIADEQARAELAEETNANAISDEETRALAAELVLTNDLATEQARAELAEETNANAIIALAAERNEEIGDLTTLNTAEKGTIVGSINEVQAEIIAEQARAELSEETNANAIADEQARAEAAELVLTTDLAAEVARAELAEETLTNNLASTVATEGTGLIGYAGYTEADVNIVNPAIEVAAGTLEDALEDIASSVNLKIHEFENRFVKAEVADADKSDVYTIGHNLDTEFVDVSVQVYDTVETTWRFDLVVVEVVDVNTVTISLAGGIAQQIRYVIQGY